jgi:hypothetical protein
MAGIFRIPLVGTLAAKVAAKQARNVTSTLSREVSRGELGEAENLCGAISLEGLRQGVPTPGHDAAMKLLRLLSSGLGGTARQDLAMEVTGRS